MKKHFISKFYIFVLAVLNMFITIPWIFFSVYALNEVNPKGWGITMLAMGIFVLFSSLYMLFFDFPSGTVEFDEHGIRQRIGRKTVNFEWDDFFEYKFLNTTFDRSDNKLYWVCCSTEYLSAKDQRNFLRKMRKKRGTIAFFQYNEEAFNDFMTYIDGEYRTVLRKEETEILANMRVMERLYNR